MGTNYYVRPEGACVHQCSSWVHLGKSSVGWRFFHRGYSTPDGDVVTWLVVDRASWLRLLDLGEIVNELGDRYGRAEFLDFIDRKQTDKEHGYPDGHDYSVGGYDFSDRWFF